MLLAEDALLLATDDETGKKLGRHTDLLVGGALLADLALAGNIRLAERGEEVRKNRALTVPDAPWPADPLLADALMLAGTKPQWSPPTLVEKLSRKRVDAVYERLARAELVSRVEHRVLGVLPISRWTSIDTRYEDGLRARLDEVFLFGVEPDPSTAALAALLSAAGVLVQVLDRGRKLDRRSVKQRGKDLQRQYWPAMALERAAQNADAAAAAAAS